jgi:hypothetical protein
MAVPRRPITVFAAVVSGLAIWSAVAAAATITVTGTGDTNAVDGLVTLREAITSINNGANLNADVVAVGVYGTSDTINFNITGAGVHTIQPTSALPSIVKPVFINGYTQGVATANTLAVGDNAVLLIEIDGTNAGLGSYAFTLVNAGGGSTFQGLVINRFKQNVSGNGGGAFLLNPSSNNTISGNFLGTNSAGTAASANQGAGVFALSASANNTIGGTTPAARNIIAANGHGGIVLGNTGTTGNLIQGNYIGTNASGTVAIPNAGGISLSSVEGNTIGGTTAGARNVISGNTSSGIAIDNNLATNNVIQGNFIGTDATGALPLPNGTSGGVMITDGFSGPATNNLIGGAAAGAGNVIAFNSGNGITIFSFQAFNNTGNGILGNSIFSNSLLGIDLGNNGVTANDLGDADAGANNLQNFPVITAVTPGVGITTIQGTLNSTASTVFTLQFFSNSACDLSGFGEGQTFLGNTTPPTVTTDGTGNVTFSVTVPTVVSGGAVIAGTATDPGNNTSEFSQCFPPGTVTPTNTPTRTPTTTPTNTPAGVATGTPTNTPTLTPTTTPTNTPTLTATPVSGTATNTPATAAVVPTLSFSMLGLLALALAAAALFLVRRP